MIWELGAAELANVEPSRRDVQPEQSGQIKGRRRPRTKHVEAVHGSILDPWIHLDLASMAGGRIWSASAKNGGAGAARWCLQRGWLKLRLRQEGAAQAAVKRRPGIRSGPFDLNLDVEEMRKS